MTQMKDRTIEFCIFFLPGQRTNLEDWADFHEQTGLLVPHQHQTFLDVCHQVGTHFPNL